MIRQYLSQELGIAYYGMMSKIVQYRRNVSKNNIITSNYKILSTTGRESNAYLRRRKWQNCHLEFSKVPPLFPKVPPLLLEKELEWNFK